MKLYYHPISTTSRPLMLFAAEAGIPLEMQVVDLFTGEHVKPPYEAINPNRLVPVLEDGAFRLTESSAILKYLADKTNSQLITLLGNVAVIFRRNPDPQKQRIQF